jgi:hypothetical protein
MTMVHVVHDPGHTAAWKGWSPSMEMRQERQVAHEQPRCGEVVGGTATECTVVCCCFLLVMPELVVLAVLCQRVMVLQLNHTTGAACCS